MDHWGHVAGMVRGVGDYFGVVGHIEIVVVQSPQSRGAAGDQGVCGGSGPLPLEFVGASQRQQGE